MPHGYPCFTLSVTFKKQTIFKFCKYELYKSWLIIDACKFKNNKACPQFDNLPKTVTDLSSYPAGQAEAIYMNMAMFR